MSRPIMNLNLIQDQAFHSRVPNKKTNAMSIATISEIDMQMSYNISRVSEPEALALISTEADRVTRLGIETYCNVMQ